MKSSHNYYLSFNAERGFWVLHSYADEIAYIKSLDGAKKIFAAVRFGGKTIEDITYESSLADQLLWWRHRLA